jgi:hypothetical protein
VARWRCGRCATIARAAPAANGRRPRGPPWRRAGPTCQQRVGGIQQLHAHALEGLGGGLDVEHVQDDGLVRAQHGAARDHRADGVADLACGREVRRQGVGPRRLGRVQRDPSCAPAAPVMSTLLGAFMSAWLSGRWTVQGRGHWLVAVGSSRRQLWLVSDGGALIARVVFDLPLLDWGPKPSSRWPPPAWGHTAHGGPTQRGGSTARCCCSISPATQHALGRPATCMHGALRSADTPRRPAASRTRRTRRRPSSRAGSSQQPPTPPHSHTPTPRAQPPRLVSPARTRPQ